MKWVAIAGSWKISAPGLEEDVRASVREIITRGDGIVSGGALGVDSIATDEALKLDGTGERTKILIPSNFEIFSAHYKKRADEEVITKEQSKDLIDQLEAVRMRNKDSLVEGSDLVLDRAMYFNRITKIVETADELYAFQVNMSEGTQDTIDKARKKGISVRVFSYTI